MDGWIFVSLANSQDSTTVKEHVCSHLYTLQDSKFRLALFLLLLIANFELTRDVVVFKGTTVITC